MTGEMMEKGLKCWQQQTIFHWWQRQNQSNWVLQLLLLRKWRQLSGHVLPPPKKKVKKVTWFNVTFKLATQLGPGPDVRLYKVQFAPLLAVGQLKKVPKKFLDSGITTHNCLI